MTAPVPDASAEVIKLGGTWGNHVGWTRPGERVAGHRSPRPKVGDLLRSPMESGRDGLFRLTAVKMCSDPSDMYFADVEWAGYIDEQ
jgi:hypothetical protein